MGYSLSWAAARGKSRDGLCRELALSSTGRSLTAPDTRYCGVASGSEWYVVIAADDRRFSDAGVLSALSVSCELISCVVEEHVMVSQVICHRDRKKVWSVSHDAQVSREHLVAEGDLPQAYQELEASARQTLARESFDVLFDVPLELARGLTGFRHDDPRLNAFDELSVDGPRNKSWLARLLS